MEPTGLVLVLAADIVRGVLHPSRLRPGRPQWTTLCTPHHGRGLSPHGQYSPSCGTWHRRAPPQAPRRNSPRTSTPGVPTRTSPGARPRAGSWWRLRQRGPALRQLSTGTLTRGCAPSCRQARFWSPRPTKVAVGRREGTTAAGPLDHPAVVLAHRRPGLCHPSRQGSFPAAPTPRRGPALQPSGGGGLGTVARREQTPGPILPPGAGPGAASRRGHGKRGIGGDRARHGVQMDNGSRPATHAAATGPPAPSTRGPLFGPPPRPHTGPVEGHAERPQGVDGDPGRTMPARSGTRAAHGPHAWRPPHLAQGVGPYGTAHRRGAGPCAGTPTGALPAGPHSACEHVKQPDPPGTAAPH